MTGPNLMMGSGPPAAPTGGAQAAPGGFPAAAGMPMQGQPQMGGAAPQGGAPPPPPPSPEKVLEARKHVNAVLSGLTGLAAKPKGDLTKKDVYDAASEMLAKGAFPTQESKQQLITELAKLPDDEPKLRKVIGQLLLQVGGAREAFHGAFGSQ